MTTPLNPAERIVHVLHTCGCTLLRVGVSSPAHCPTHDRLTEAVGSRWAHTAVYYAAAGGTPQAFYNDTLDEGPRPSTHGAPKGGR